MMRDDEKRGLMRKKNEREKMKWRKMMRQKGWRWERTNYDVTKLNETPLCRQTMRENDS